MDVRALLIAIAASIALLRFKAPMIPTLAVAGGIGVVLTLMGV
jgi:hypothetical protein